MKMGNLLILTLLLTGRCFAQSNPAENPHVTELLNLAKKNLGAGKYEQAESACKSAISEAPTSSQGRQLLGEIYIHEGKFSDAWAVLTRGWRRGRSIQHDMLMGIADIYGSKNRSAMIYVGIPVLYFGTDVEKQRLGNVSSSLNAHDINQLGAYFYLMFAADPAVGAVESLDFAKKADTLVPSLPATAYVMGVAEARLGKLPEGRSHLEFAVSNGDPKLADLARNALSGLGSKKG